MQRRLRLAERRGLLSGRHTNVVQDFGLELLVAWEDNDNVEKEVQQFKKMLGASHPHLIKTLWPESFDDKEDSDGTRPVAYEKSMDKEEGMRLIEQLRKQKMSASLSELEETGWM